MLHRIIFYFMILLIAILLPVRSVFAQECIGATAYIVRDEAGRVMNLQETKKLVVKVDGVALDQKHFTASISSEFLPDQKEFKEANPLVFFGVIPDGAKTVVGYCGKIGEVVIIYGGKQMRLLFDIDKHNTLYVIDSLPFQEGTFHLRSLKCKDGARPPMIDNNTIGKCVVSADNWEGMEKEWVRRLSKNDYIGIRSDQSRSCRSKVISVISRQTDLAAAADLYPEIKRGGTLLPAIDFKTEIALIISTPRLLSYGSIIVDKNGDLTLDQPPEDSDNNCHMFFLRVYRSGVKSIEGNPLPPAPTQ
jgi:hypothetical protein